jgi:chromosome condensin MukBEF ATPase and DNA-binding subunit MukB
MSDNEIVITFQSERDLWYVQLGEATAVVSAEDMVHEYYRWRRVGAPGQWRDNAHEFCRRRVANPESKRSNLVQRRTTTCGTNCDR